MASLISSVVNFNWRPLKYNTAPIKDFYRLRFKYRYRYPCFNQIMCLIFISTLNLTFFQDKVQGAGPGCEWDSEAMCQQGWTEICTQGIIISFDDTSHDCHDYDDVKIVGGLSNSPRKYQMFSLRESTSVADNTCDDFLWHTLSLRSYQEEWIRRQTLLSGEKWKWRESFGPNTKYCLLMKNAYEAENSLVSSSL